jgi:hypothetical protein
MTEYEDMRTDLQVEVFDVVGKTVTLKSRALPTYNSRGEEESITYSESSITIVPYNLIDNRQSYQQFSNMEEGESLAAIPYDVTVAVDDIIEMEGYEWNIKQIEPNYLPENVVTIVRLIKGDSLAVSYDSFLTSDGDTFLTADGDTFKVTGA